jgi:sarcosine oxidase delta subunit
MAYPFRAPRTIVEALKMADSAAAARAAGRMDDADIMEAALRSVSFDPDSIDTVRIRELANFNPPVSRDPDIGVTLRGLANQDIPAPSATSFEDMAQGIDQSVRNYNWMRSNRAGGMKNQWRGDIGGRDIRYAAQEGIDRAAAAQQAERMATAAAIAGAAGLGGMIAESVGRLPGDDASVANAPAPDMPPEPPMPGSDPLMDFVAPDVEMLPVDDMPIEEEKFSPVTLSDAEMGLTDFSPMDTADLVAESRPIPASTPTVMPETLTPEEIAALRGQVVSIRDAKTGQAMDSFYPPESEEYKREQRMKLRYPQMRR